MEKLMKTCIVFTLLLCMVNTIKANAVNGNAIEIPLTAIEGGRCVDISLNKFSICNNDINESATKSTFKTEDFLKMLTV